MEDPVQSKLQYHNCQKSLPKEVKPKGNDQPLIVYEYYQRPFALFHEEIDRQIGKSKSPHPVRERFWQLMPLGKHPLPKGREFLQSYLATVETEIERIVKQASLAYWIHLYRRLLPGPIGENKEPPTILLTRRILEASIQKYARIELCNRIGFSKDIGIEQVFKGLLLADEFRFEREIFSQIENQLILTNFTSIEMLEFYDLEALAFEVWRATATLRSIAKGGSFAVVDPPICYGDYRSDELARLLRNYDGRDGRFVLSSSASGVTFSDKYNLSAEGYAFLPTYNVSCLKTESFQKPLRLLFNMSFHADHMFNFLWASFNLREFRIAHLSYADAFHKKHKGGMRDGRNEGRS
jgi:hypothetical protein